MISSKFFVYMLAEHYACTSTFCCSVMQNLIIVQINNLNVTITRLLVVLSNQPHRPVQLSAELNNYPSVLPSSRETGKNSK